MITKVERPIDYLRERFWRGYGFDSIEKANRDVLTCLDETAHERIHGTHRQVVRERWKQEIPSLGVLPPADYDTSIKVFRKVYKDCRISYGCNRYLLPHHAVGDYSATDGYVKQELRKTGKGDGASYVLALTDQTFIEYYYSAIE